LILGILAAIAIPAFFNQREKARDADAKSAVRTAQTAMETYATDHNGSYANADLGDLQAIEATLNDEPGTSVTVASDPDEYTLEVTSQSGNTFSIQRLDTGNAAYDCTTENQGGCPEGGDWGGEEAPAPAP
jgi:type IV pilus assembly protein PilA